MIPLFILGSKLLSTYLHETIQMRLLQAYKPRLQGPEISRLLYANDCLFVTRATVHDAVTLKSILDA